MPSEDSFLVRINKTISDAMTVVRPTPLSERAWNDPARYVQPILNNNPFYERERDNIGDSYNQWYLQPMWSFPVADLFSQPLQRQHSPCSPVEMQALECIEYYGAHRGVKICKKYYDDFLECTVNKKQRFRFAAITQEYRKRSLEALRGDRDKNDVYKPIPPPHAYEEPHRFKYTVTDGSY